MEKMKFDMLMALADQAGIGYRGLTKDELLLKLLSYSYKK